MDRLIQGKPTPENPQTPVIRMGELLAKKDLGGNPSSQAAALGEVVREVLSSAGFPLVLEKKSYLPSIQPTDKDLPFEGLRPIPKEPGSASPARFRDPRVLFYGNIANFGVISNRPVLNDAAALLNWVKRNPQVAPYLYFSHYVVNMIQGFRTHPEDPQNQAVIREILFDLARYTSDPEKAKDYIKRLKIS